MLDTLHGFCKQGITVAESCGLPGETVSDEPPAVIATLYLSPDRVDEIQSIIVRLVS